MPLTDADDVWLAMRKDLTDPEKAVCDSIIRDAFFSARAHGVPLCAFSDEAVAFEAACVRFVLSSRAAN